MLLSERRDKICLFTLNRPEKRNALHPTLVNLLLDSLRTVAADSAINVVVITGAGTSFCAGLDLENTLGVSEQQKDEGFGNVFEVFRTLYSMPQPVIAAVNGPAIAGGFDLAQFCDLRLAVPTATFAQAEINLGLTQMLYPLYKSIGMTRAKELAMTGRVITAEEAERIGFINFIYSQDELMTQALLLAKQLASNPREALIETKRLSRELLELDAESAFQRMGQAIRERLLSDEHKETLEKYKAQRKHKL